MVNSPSLSLSLLSATEMTNPKVLGDSTRPPLLKFVFVFSLRVKDFNLESFV